jgi:hypothetical protein
MTKKSRMKKQFWSLEMPSSPSNLNNHRQGPREEDRQHSHDAEDLYAKKRNPRDTSKKVKCIVERSAHKTSPKAWSLSPREPEAQGQLREDLNTLKAT